MPGRIFLEQPLEAYAALMGSSGDGGTASPGLDIAPGEQIAVVDAQRNFTSMRWGMIMSGRVNARNRPVMETIVNARSETVHSKSAFADVLPALVPCDGWYEWTGKTRSKTRWRIRRKDGAPIVFAAIYDIWDGPGGVKVPQVATITCEPNLEIREIHHRMGVIVAPEQFGAWLSGDRIDMEPASDGTLLIEKTDMP